jgi:hypothetical protein
MLKPKDGGSMLFQNISTAYKTSTLTVTAVVTSELTTECDTS